MVVGCMVGVDDGGLSKWLGGGGMLSVVSEVERSNRWMRMIFSDGVFDRESVLLLY